MRILAIAFALVVVGCSAGSDDTASTTTARSEATPPLRLYFVRDEQLAVSTRDVSRAAAGPEHALSELVAGPDSAEDLQTAIPSGTSVRGVRVEGGIATVDLSRSFESGGGSLSMLLRVAQVVYTLTQFPSVNRVAFALDGTPVDAIGGEGVVVSPPVGPAAFEDVTPAILVESVGPGDEVRSPLRVTGTANTFEATMFLRIVDASGQKLVDQLVTASSGSGTRGTFDALLRFGVAADGNGTLVAYEHSAEDGSETHVVRIPVELRR